LIKKINCSLFHGTGAKRCRSCQLTGGGLEKNNRKKWRSKEEEEEEEEERHKGALTKKAQISKSIK
jgi:hypothetical protein